MLLEERIDALVQLGKIIEKRGEQFEAVIEHTYIKNQWFTIENVNMALEAIISQFLQKEKLVQWIGNYKVISDPSNAKKVGMVMAGNIPLVGFHDVLCCFISGHISKVKLSSKDEFLLPYLIDQMIKYNKKVAFYFEFVDRLNDIEAVIATGSNNAADHFERYFSKYPHIIRRNRNAIAVFSGKESKEEMISFGKDIFSFYGLGCRNVSKIYIPENFDIKILIEIMHDNYKKIILHSKYKNNYDYNYAIFLMNREPFLMSGSLIWREHKDILSRISCVHYEKYSDRNTLDKDINTYADQIQCIVAKDNYGSFQSIPFGKGQSPTLSDYADNVDTMAFLSQLS